jgi:hypothetical protein
VFLAVWFSGRIRDWSVMTDELQYAKLAVSIGETHSPLPMLHGTSVSIANQLYPLLLAPLYGSLSSPDAFRAAHLLNAGVMASAVFPVYLLARELLCRAWSLGVAVLAVVTPWLVLTGFVMSEVVAYPVFAWAMLAVHRTIAVPTARRDLLAALAVAVAIVARTQFAALGVVLPLGILGHELGSAVASPGASRRRALASAVRTAARGHGTLWGVYAASGALAGIVTVVGYRLFGAYNTAVESGSLLPPAVWVSAVRHLDVVGIGCGLAPLVLGGGWILAAIVRPQSPERHAFATLAGLTIVLLAVETASFDIRFGGPDVMRDRYLFYAVPLLLVGSAAALTEARRGPVAIGAAAATSLVAATVAGLPFPTFPGVSVDTPVSVFNETLIEQSAALGTGTFVAFVVLLVGVVLVLSLLVAPRIPAALALFVIVLAFSGHVLRTEVNRILEGTSLSDRPLAGPPGVVLDWVDSVVAEGQQVAIAPFPVSTAWGSSAIHWWNVEFWNRTITRSYVAQDGNFTYTPFPDRVLRIDRVTGDVARTADAPRYVVVVPDDPRFGLAGRVHATNVGLVVLAVDRPYRAAWSSRGLRADGWTDPDEPASIRVYPRPGVGPRLERLHVWLRAPGPAGARYTVSSGPTTRTATISAGASSEETVLVCVAPHSPADVTVTTATSARIESAPLTPEVGAMRRVGVRLGPIRVEPTGRPCTA